MTAVSAPSGDGGHALDVLDRPAMLIHDTAVRSNIDLMARYCSDRGVLHAPHAKTSMTSYVVDLQSDAGAWGQTVASAKQAMELWEMGVRRFVLANMLVDERAITWVTTNVLSRPESDADLMCYVDSQAGVEILERNLAETSRERKLGVLVELGYPGGRTGVRSVDDAVSLASRVARSSYLDLRGVACFEGLISRGGKSPVEAVASFLGSVRQAVVRIQADGGFRRPPVVTAGGSSYFDVVVDVLGPTSFEFDVTTILRSGCYATHDHGLYREASPFDGRAVDPEAPRLLPALELIATVLSRPEPELVIAGFGRRDVPTDDRLPIVLGVFDASRQLQSTDAEVVGVNDQHAMVKVAPESSLSPGEVMSLGVSHPCGAFDRWRSLAIVSDQRHVIGVAHPRL